MALFIDKLAVTSSDFTTLDRIPDQFSADAGNEFPSLTIEGSPAGTTEFALICHDPDAPIPNGFTHLTVYGIPADATTVDLAGTGVRVGPNTMGDTEWSGPQPPFGHGTHHYYFWAYALSRPVEGTPTREEFLANYGDAIIEQARIVGTFSR